METKSVPLIHLARILSRSIRIGEGELRNRPSERERIFSSPHPLHHPSHPPPPSRRTSRTKPSHIKEKGSKAILTGRNNVWRPTTKTIGSRTSPSQASDTTDFEELCLPGRFPLLCSFGLVLRFQVGPKLRVLNLESNRAGNPPPIRSFTMAIPSLHNF